MKNTTSTPSTETTGTGIIPIKHEPAPTIFSPKEAAQMDKIREFGEKLIGQASEQAKTYLDLCLYIRKEQVDKKLVAHTLSAQGFHKVRISEINRVATAPEEYFNQYAAKALGFKRVLQLVRGEGDKATATPAAKMLGITDGKAALMAEAEIEETETQGQGPKESDRKAKSPTEKADMGAATIFKAVGDGCRRKEWKSGDGLILRLVKDVAQQRRVAKLKAVAGTPAAAAAYAEVAKGAK